MGKAVRKDFDATKVAWDIRWTAFSSVVRCTLLIRMSDSRHSVKSFFRACGISPQNSSAPMLSS